MARLKPQPVTLIRLHPFERMFPATTLWLRLFAALIKLVGLLGRAVWPWRTELALLTLVWFGWHAWCHLMPEWWALTATMGVGGAALAWAPLRGWAWGRLRCARTRRLVLAGLAETRTANPSGQLPRIVRVSPTPVGERVHLRVRAGQSAELLDARVEELRAAVRARDVRITKNPRNAHRVLLDVVRRDPLAATADVAWLDRDADVLSMWNPVHLGTDETGEAVRVSFTERSLLVGGEPGSGKSTLLNIVASHAALSPDAHLILIDPNEVQFAAWRDRALAYASDDPVEALDVLELVRAEIRRRLGVLKTLPGVVRKITPDVAAEHNFPLWVLLIDELAFHTSVVGTTGQRAAFNTAARDIVARCRAAGVIPLMATQRPTSDIVPTSLRDLFSLRCAFRTTTTTSSDVILGDSWARQGYSASDIDLTARGVGWLLAEGHQPKRIKAAWISDTTIADLAVTTVRHKPRRAITETTMPTPRTDPEDTR